MSVSYYLIGPIESDDTILLVANIKKIPYFLTLDSGRLVFDPRTNGPNKPLQLSVSVTTHGVSLSFTNSQSTKSYVGVNKTDSDTIAIVSNVSGTLIPSSPDVNEWGEFLAGVHYTFHGSKGALITWQAYVPDPTSIQNGIPTSIAMTDGQPEIQNFRDIIRVLPGQWYEEGSCAETTGIEAVIQAEVMWVTETGQVPNGYTDLDDCQVGVRYSYCGKNVDCSKSCKGPCTRVGVDCSFNNDVNGFACTDPPKPEEPIYRRPWFLVGISIIAVIVVLLFFLFLFRFRK